MKNQNKFKCHKISYEDKNKKKFVLYINILYG